MKVFFLSLYLIFLGSVFAEDAIPEMKGGILYGQNWSCLISAPDGWVLDNQSWVKYGIYAMFYPKGSNINGKTRDFPIIYFNADKLKESTDNDLLNYVDFQINNYKKNNVFLISERKIELKRFNVFRCYDVDNTKTGQFVTIVFLRYKDGAHLIFLTSFNKDQREQLIPVLEKCIDDMQFGDARIQK